jgi:hypothetical protein
MRLFGIILIAMLGTAGAGLSALQRRKWKLAAGWLGACAMSVICGVLLLQSWNRVMLRVNQMPPATRVSPAQQETPAE